MMGFLLLWRFSITFHILLSIVPELVLYSIAIQIVFVSLSKIRVMLDFCMKTSPPSAHFQPPARIFLDL